MKLDPRNKEEVAILIRSQLRPLYQVKTEKLYRIGVKPVFPTFGNAIKYISSHALKGWLSDLFLLARNIRLYL